MKITKELKIGIFVIFVLTASFFVINFLRGKDIFGKEIDVVSFYENVEGLLPSAPVYIKGYKAGAVSDVVYRPETGEFEVICSVLKEFVIPEDSRIIIYSVDIMGGKGVRIDLGTSETPVSDGGRLKGGSQPDLIATVSESIGPLLDRVTGTMDSLSVTVNNINRILAAADEQSIRRTLAHLENTLANAEKLSASINGKSDELSEFIVNLANISGKLDGVMAKADAAMGNVADVTSALSEGDIEGLVLSFKGLLDKIQDPDGSIGKLLNDGSVYTSVDTLLEDIDSLVRKIEQNPKKYIKISVF